MGNVTKISNGGWFPLAIGVVSCLVMLTWNWGRLEFHAIKGEKLSASNLKALLSQADLHTVETPTVYLHRNAAEIPPAFTSNIRFNHVMHTPVAFVSITFSDTAWVPLEGRIKERQIMPGVIQIEGIYGFKQRPDVPHLLKLSENAAFSSSESRPLYVIGRTRLIKDPQRKIRTLRRLLFQLLHRNSGDPIEQFHLPTDDVVEVGERVVI